MLNSLIPLEVEHLLNPTELFEWIPFRMQKRPATIRSLLLTKDALGNLTHPKVSERYCPELQERQTLKESQPIHLLCDTGFYQ